MVTTLLIFFIIVEFILSVFIIGTIINMKFVFAIIATPIWLLICLVCYELDEKRKKLKKDSNLI